MPLFGENPDIERTTKVGGNIRFEEIWRPLFWGVLFIIIIYLLVKLFQKLRFNGEDYYQRKTHHYFNNLHGDANDEDAQAVIEYGEQIANPQAMDHYRIGTTYLINIQNPHQAFRHYQQALNEIIGGRVDVYQAPFIIDRINDYTNFFTDFPEIEDLPIQLAIAAYYDAKQNEIQNIPKQLHEINTNDPDFRSKILLNQQRWYSDAQNVHDTAIYNSLENQFQYVRNANAQCPELQSKNYEDAINWLRLNAGDDPVKKNKIDKVINIINNNYHVPNLGVNEQDIITQIWKRIHNPVNRERIGELREAFSDAILDCVEGDSIVCIDGRISKVWQALARLDQNPEIGVLKSKQVIRNEIFDRAAKIISDYVGSNGVVSDSLKEAYMKNEDTEQVKEIVEVMKTKIADLQNEYRDKLPPDQLNLIIQECQAVV